MLSRHADAASCQTNREAMSNSCLWRRGAAAVVVTLVFVFWARVVRANHGPGASGGGSATIAGETLRQGKFELSLREDFTQFEAFDTAAAVARAMDGGSFDALNHGFITTADLAYGITDDLQIGGSIGYFAGQDFISADTQPDGTVEVSKTNPDGLTDLALLAKYRVLSGQPGNLAVIGGVVIPT